MVLLIEPGTLVCTNSSAEGGFAGRMLETQMFLYSRNQGW